MSLKFRLAFLFSLSVFIILLVSALSIYFLNENFRKEEFIKRLRLECSESAAIFFNSSASIKGIIEDLNKNAANSLQKEEIYIFDRGFNLLHSTRNSPPSSISAEIFELAKKMGYYYFADDQGRENILSYDGEHEMPVYVLTSAYDVYGRRKSDNLKLLLALSVLGGLLLSGFLAFFYVRQAMNPLEELKRQIEKIDEKNLKERILVGRNNNEVWQIAKKFNAMLDRLQQAFEQRKSFVQHASHELRTPLANMLSQTESALSKNMTAEDHRQTLLSLKEEQQDLIDLTNSLLTLSRYESITSVADWSLIRIDEVLYEAVDFAKQMWPNGLVTVNFETMPQNEHELEFQGNESLIRSAVQNVIKNGIRYSNDKRVEVYIQVGKKGINLHFDNSGNQLSFEEQSKLFIPFFRGENSINKKGYGIGLSIVQRVVEVHKGTISYRSIDNKINRFTIHLPSVKQ